MNDSQPDAPAGLESTSSPLVEVRRVGKSFPGVRALNEIDLALAAGEVLALVGENGAGKSTMMKILAGVDRPDEGQLFVDGRQVQFRNVADAMRLGITLIHQELNLADNLSVAANVFLGREPTRLGLIDESEMELQSQRHLRAVGLRVSPQTLVSDLSIGRQQMVEIAKALSMDARVLIMDEPTSSLSQKEADTLLDVVDELRDRGVSIIYITHRLAEVQRIADRVLVMRDGENAGQLQRDEINHDAMVSRMVGRDVSRFYVRRGSNQQAAKTSASTPALEVCGLVVPEHPKHKVDFSVMPGEIVGVAGLVGAGRTEMLRCLFGVNAPLAGTIQVDGVAISASSPHEAMNSGIGLVPEDRKGQGLIIDFDIRSNISLACLDRDATVGALLNETAQTQHANENIERLNIKTPSANQIAGKLSGGNQQKVVLGKWLAMGPRVLLLDEPTRGIDIGAKEEIYQLMEKLAGENMAILFVSSEMEEVIGMADRVLVMHEGKLTGQLTGDAISEANIMNLATGQTQES